jgi:hypothetical protein
MPIASSLSPSFEWLSPACRPTPQEVQRYANLIADVEGEFAESPESRFRQAELQLWIWRNETRLRSPQRRRRVARPVDTADVTDFSDPVQAS